jgi:hypothetical protein
MRLVRLGACLAGLALVLGGCADSLLSVDNPDVVKPGKITGEVAANALFEGARSEFIAAHDGDGSITALPSSSGLVYVSGLFADEFLFPATPPSLIEIDRRAVQRTNDVIAAVYLVMHRARLAAERAIEALSALPGAGADPRLGEAHALGALMYTLFGETFCNGVPFSESKGGIIENGDPVSIEVMFQTALTKLDAAATKTGGDEDVANLVRVGRGRTLVDLGRFADAATAVASVPTSFSFANPHSTDDPRAQNYIKGVMWDTFFLGVADQEGTNGLDFVTAGDPRVVTVDGGQSNFDQQTEVFRFTGYESGAAPVILASGLEARLIEAEAALEAGSVTAWRAKLDEVRAAAGLLPIVDPGSPAARLDLTYRERAFALFGTAHRFGDLRRLVRVYNRGAETVFPTGDYHKDNLVRGVEVAFPVPQTEENNPKYTSAACDPNKA